jgi:hypothetical protein
MDTYEYVIAKLSRNNDVVNIIETTYAQDKLRDIEKSKINGIIKLDTTQLQELNTKMRDLVKTESYNKQTFAEYANEYKALLNTYSNIYEKIFIQQNKIITVDEGIPGSSNDSSYIFQFNSKLYKKLIITIKGNLVIPEFFDISNTYIVTDTLLYERVLEQNKGISKNLANDIAFIILLLVNIRITNEITVSDLSSYTNTGEIVYLTDDNNILKGAFEPKKLLKQINVIVKDNITLINKVISDFIPVEILPEITL